MSETDFRYKCFECKKEFTLHADSDTFDCIEFDPMCPWCGNDLGAPIYLAKASDPPALAALAASQALMAPMFVRGRHDEEERKVAERKVEAAHRADPEEESK